MRQKQGDWRDNGRGLNDEVKLMQTNVRELRCGCKEREDENVTEMHYSIHRNTAHLQACPLILHTTHTLKYRDRNIQLKVTHSCFNGTQTDDIKTLDILHKGQNVLFIYIFYILQKPHIMCFVSEISLQYSMKQSSTCLNLKL